MVLTIALPSQKSRIFQMLLDIKTHTDCSIVLLVYIPCVFLPRLETPLQGEVLLLSPLGCLTVLKYIKQNTDKARGKYISFTCTALYVIFNLIISHL